MELPLKVVVSMRPHRLVTIEDANFLQVARVLHNGFNTLDETIDRAKRLVSGINLVPLSEVVVERIE